jgi:hypothetical protein
MSTGDASVDAQLRVIAEAAPPFTDGQFAYISGLMKRHARRVTNTEGGQRVVTADMVTNLKEAA